ncbi:uncharacterized protein TrAFT101_007665 [Trichoderma asperellum]|uniref:uncharacterized protein n=1 Tax=Trichoderma asperellum TaxID=101201 RepID=UPI00332B87DE|nr:hypothetical protein TrAFT101_007665 [Trichoderma asperellum]
MPVGAMARAPFSSRRRAVPTSDLVLRAIHDISRLMQATGGRSVLILGAQGRGGDGMEIDEHAKAQAVVSPWLRLLSLAHDTTNKKGNEPDEMG